MSEQEPSDDRTEAASPHRLSQAFDQGDVPVSRDVTAAASLAAGAWAVLALGAEMRDALVRLVHASMDRLSDAEPGYLLALMPPIAGLIAAVCGAVMVAAVLASGLQTRFGFWMELVWPKLDRVLSGARFGRLFSKEVLVDLGLDMAKIVTLFLALWWALRDEFVTLPRLMHQPADGLLAGLFGPMERALVNTLTALVFIAGADLAVKRFRHRGKLKMSKDELRREHKDEEGDPLIRSRRRRQHREIARGRVAAEVPRADVVVVNPTHLAVALRYRPDEDRAPRVTAKGKGEQADRIRALARENGVPIVENVPLARLLYKRVKIGRTIPAETFKAVAAVLAFVYRALGRTSGQEARP